MTSSVDLETAFKVLDSSFAFYLVETDVYAVALNLVQLISFLSVLADMLRLDFFIFLLLFLQTTASTYEKIMYPPEDFQDILLDKVRSSPCFRIYNQTA